MRHIFGSIISQAEEEQKANVASNQKPYREEQEPQVELVYRSYSERSMVSSINQPRRVQRQLGSTQLLQDMGIAAVTPKLRKGIEMSAELKAQRLRVQHLLSQWI